MRSSTDQFKAHRRQVELEQYSWRNQRTPTESEARLWEALHGRKLGVQFRGQMPLAGRYIVDFVAPAARLVVEVDGSYHSGRRRADEQRDRRLTRLGLPRSAPAGCTCYVPTHSRVAARGGGSLWRLQVTVSKLSGQRHVERRWHQRSFWRSLSSLRPYGAARC
jgi:very-short-patch-repair endonuclease